MFSKSVKEINWLRKEIDSLLCKLSKLRHGVTKLSCQICT